MKVLGKMMNALMLSCEEATLLMTKKQYERLPLLKNMQLRIHLMTCKLCRRFEIQNDAIQQFWTEFENQHQHLSDEKKKEIQHSIEEQQHH